MEYNQGIKHKIFIYVSIVLITVCVLFAVSNITVRYIEYTSAMRQEGYLVENNQRFLTSQLSRVLKSNLSRIIYDSSLVEAVVSRNIPLLMGRMSMHTNALDFEYPDDVFVFRIVAKDGRLLFSSDRRTDHCPKPISDAALNELSGKAAGNAYELCTNKILQFSALPIYNSGELVGVVELGTSLEFYGRAMEQSTGYSMAVLANTDTNLLEGMPRYGRYALMQNTDQTMFRRLLNSVQNYDKLPDMVNIGNMHYRISDDMRFYSAEGREAGRFIYAKDVTSDVSAMLSYTLSVVFMTMVFCIISLMLIRVGFNRTVGTLEKAHELTINKLLVSEEKHKEYIDNSPMSIFTTNDSKIFTDANKRFLDMTGTSKNELVVKSLYDFVTDNRRNDINKFYSKAFHEGSNSGVLYVVNRTGKEIAMMAKAVKMSERSLLFNCLDITHSIEMENKLKELNFELETMNRNLEKRIEEEVEKNRRQSHILAEQKKLADMGLMVSAIAHQWRQPLNALGIMLQSIPDALNIDETSPEYTDYEKTAMLLVKKMSDTIDNFRLFFETGERKEKFNVVDELQNTHALLSVHIASKNIKTKFMCRREPDIHFSPCLSCGRCNEITLYGQPGEFRQMLMNILNNSYEAIIERMSRQPELEGSIAINIVCSDERVTISVEDNGTGVSPEILDRIFEPYFSTKNDAKFSGIGLYMVKVLTEQNLGGKVAAFNNHLGGLTVVMDFRLSGKPDQVS
ncbi:ATP-binding protein [Seleniivibrio sp.]|uniref:ATP-binding protein n=1 Tax=Seleniivibrio sp. TaxID=2898801 RepID=UPI0025CDB9A8|nr:ATP-binding protein [Seleniivibrio sp.]MCD8553197.1 ATP-binding protein [Seleniivibrio sp.]